MNDANKSEVAQPHNLFVARRVCGESTNPKHPNPPKSETQTKPSGLFLGYENETKSEPNRKLNESSPVTSHQAKPTSGGLEEPPSHAPNFLEADCPAEIDKKTGEVISWQT